MRLFFPLLTYLALCAGLACKPSQESTEHNPPADSTKAPAQTSPVDSTKPPPPPTAVVQNASRIEAVVEQMQDLSGTQFTAKILVVTSVPLNGRTTLVEEGQRIIVGPHYYADSTGKVSFEEPRNKRILSIKKLQAGQGFKGNVMRNRYGGWDLIDVEEPEK